LISTVRFCQQILLDFCCQSVVLLCEQILLTKQKHNGNAVDVSLLTFSDQICCQSIDILLTFCLLGIVAAATTESDDKSMTSLFSRNTATACHNDLEHSYMSNVIFSIIRNKGALKRKSV